MQRQPNFIVDIESFRLIQDEVGIGRIVALSDDDSSLITPHIQGHPETLYTACSGVALSAQHGNFRADGGLVAIEWVRLESKPQPNEPECNAYRYLFGLTADGKCYGYDVTRPTASPFTGQVADHWTTFDEVWNRHFK